MSQRRSPEGLLGSERNPKRVYLVMVNGLRGFRKLIYGQVGYGLLICFKSIS
jgi:hypothetical protein